MTQRADGETWEQLFNSKFIRWFDLDGKDHSLEITAVDVEELTMQGGQTEKKPVITLKGASKRWVINKTIAQQIAKVTKKNKPAEWVGQKVTLYPTTCKFGRDTVGCIRVRT